MSTLSYISNCYSHGQVIVSFNKHYRFLFSGITICIDYSHITSAITLAFIIMCLYSYVYRIYIAFIDSYMYFSQIFDNVRVSKFTYLTPCVVHEQINICVCNFLETTLKNHHIRLFLLVLLHVIISHVIIFHQLECIVSVPLPCSVSFTLLHCRL